MAGRKPDYWLSARIRGTPETSKVGVAWRNPNGSISIDLNSFVFLQAKPDLDLMLYPIETADVSTQERDRRAWHARKNETGGKS